MQPTPSPSTSRGAAVLQPSYFTSSLYIDPLRHDISALIQCYREQYSSRDPSVAAFTLFKQIWHLQGWNWLHFKIFDNRARDMFLHVTMRLFLERTTETEELLVRVVGLFALYTFYYTQPANTVPPLWRVKYIPIPMDYLSSVMNLAAGLVTSELQPLRPAVLHVTTRLVRDGVFYVLPRSNLGAENPRTLPREICVDPTTTTSFPLESNALKKKKGRPSRRDKVKRAKMALEGLDGWLETSEEPCSSALTEDDGVARYQAAKAELIGAIEAGRDTSDMDPVRRVNMVILERLREAQAMQGGEEKSIGVERVERAVRALDDVYDARGGVLGLMEGAGKS